jgi:hypothetical protein
MTAQWEGGIGDALVETTGRGAGQQEGQVG